MILTLIGMSGVGKTFWAEKLGKAGFTVIDCDARIAARLRAQDPSCGVTQAEVGAWMGFPHHAAFAHREAMYRACETAVLREILPQLSGWAAEQRDVLVDTGGSMLYAEPALLESLGRATKIVYLRLSPGQQETLLAQYLTQPRSLVWNGVFEQRPAESLALAFRRSYRRLLAQRTQLYERYGAVVLEAAFHGRPGLTPQQFLRRVRGA